MRKTIFSVLMIPLLLLAGCGEREARLEAVFDGLRQDMIAAEEITFTASVTADRGDTEEVYDLAVHWDGERTEMELIEPECIAGIKASVKWGETEVAYEGVLLPALVAV